MKTDFFQEKWENGYFVTNVWDKIHCVSGF